METVRYKVSVMPVLRLSNCRTVSDKDIEGYPAGLKAFFSGPVPGGLFVIDWPQSPLHNKNVINKESNIAGGIFGFIINTLNFFKLLLYFDIIYTKI